MTSTLLTANLITKQQHAFISRHSTTSNLLECKSDWSLALNHKTSVDVIYIDFARAFDSVVHAKLWYKLCNMGVPSKFISWIEFFITSRSQAVTIENNISSTTVVLSGVPQGSVLGPLLFILYVNDIESIFNESIIFKLFADDLKLYNSLDTNFHHSHMQEAINSVVAWSVTWQLPINIPNVHLFTSGLTTHSTLIISTVFQFPCQTLAWSGCWSWSHAQVQ